ncbi:MAG TPA: extracellular solute-binding protein [Chloroflexota bacterium]|nr:extracellular solute-binding protein [Chloroflexota bacterium]
MPRHLTRRALSAALSSLAALAGASTLAAVAGCGPGSGGPSAGAGPRRQDGVVLQLWGSYGAGEREALLKYYARFADEQAPGLTTEFQIYSNADFMGKLTAALAGGTGPDFTRFKEYQAIDMAARKSALALDGYLSRDRIVKLADFTPQSVEGSKYESKTYGVPHHHQFVMLGWNKALFRAAGLDPERGPATIAELRDYARRLTQPAKQQWGFRLYEFGPPPREQIFNWFMEWVWREGGDVWNRDRTRATLDSPESIQAMQTMVDMIYADKSTIPPPERQLAIESGALGMWMPTGAGVLNLKKTAPDLSFGLGSMPRSKQFATQLQHNTFSIMTNSKLQDLAWQAIAFMCRDDVMQQWQSDPGISTIPVKRALLDQAPWSDPASGWTPIVEVVKMPGNRAKPHIPDWDEYTERTIVPFLTEAWRQEKTPKDALTEANRMANAWLAERRK